MEFELLILPGEPTLIEQMTAEFPHISRNDIISVLTWVGYGTNDLFDQCAYIDINCTKYYVPGVLIAKAGLRSQTAPQLGTTFDTIPA